MLIIAGEDSGDLHGAALITELKKLDPGIMVSGIGGDKMRAAGVDLIYHINKMSFMGFAEVIKHIPFIKKVQKHLLEYVKERNIGTAVLIDYPGFNLSFARKVSSSGTKVIYYISPQVWAWGKNRIKKIKKYVHKMLVILSFEEKFFTREGIKVEYVGHPLLEQLDSYKFLTKEELYSRASLEKEKDILLILPGSRKHEVEQIFPAALEAALKAAKEFNMQVVTACSSNIDESIFKRIVPDGGYKIVKGLTYDLLKYSKFGIVKSGTSTLEAALFELPMVIVYKTSRLTYFIGKMVVNVKNIGLVNIIAEEEIVPELIQDKVNEDDIYNKISEYILDKNKYDQMKSRLSQIKNKLGKTGASKRAAEIIYKELNEH